MQFGRPTIRKWLAAWRAVPRGPLPLALALFILAGVLLIGFGPRLQLNAGITVGQIAADFLGTASGPLEPPSAQIAILCLALATMLLVLRHARYRFRQYVQAETANRELQRMQSQLVQSEKLAAIGQLAAGVAHEMNTPLGFVTCNFDTLEGYVKKALTLLELYELLARKVETANGEDRLQTLEAIRQVQQQTQFDLVLRNLQELLDDSREGLERVTTIIQSLRDFSRVDQVGNLASFNVNEGIAATLTVARYEIERNAQVETEFGDVPDIVCNPGQVNQVFLNVLVNAAQAIAGQTRKSMGHIAIRTFEADGYVVCEIEDDGPGIAADRLRKVFDPFFTTKAAGKGTGLGLSVSHDIIVNKHEGLLLVESEEGQGTKFTIKLPLTPLDEPPEQPGPVRASERSCRR